MASPSAPICLSVVVAARNDDHGGDLLHRVRLFLSTFIEQADRYGLRSEIVVVEWNPPADRPRFPEALTWKESSACCDVRVICVPAEAHRRFTDADVLPLYQFIAKNVGIRRSRGRFVLATNVDILFSDELIRHLASGRLRDDEMVRADRFDVPSDIREDWDTAQRLEYCRSRALRVYRNTGTYELGGPADPGARFVRRARADVHSAILRARGRVRAVYTNACGDFTLLHREGWAALHAYPELPMHGVFIDGILCHAAVASGIRQRVLAQDCCVYHIDHAGSWTPRGAGAVEESLRRRKVPFLSSGEYECIIDQLRQGEVSPVLSSEAWGLGSETLAETLVVKADTGILP